MSATEEFCGAWASPDHAEWQIVRGAVSKCADINELSRKVIDGAWADVLMACVARPMIEAIAQTMHVSLQGAREKDAVVVPFTQVKMHVPSPQEAMHVAIAALHIFVQLNWTGPDVALQPTELLRLHAPQYMPMRSVDSDDEDSVYARLLHASSLEYLTWHGEPA